MKRSLVYRSIGLVLVLLLFGCRSVSPPSPEKVVFRILDIEYKTLEDELMVIYADGLYWVTAIVLEPEASLGQHFRFGCEDMPKYCVFEVGHVYESHISGFLSFESWAHQYESIVMFDSQKREIKEVKSNDVGTVIDK